MNSYVLCLAQVNRSKKLQSRNNIIAVCIASPVQIKPNIPIRPYMMFFEMQVFVQVFCYLFTHCPLLCSTKSPA